LENIRAKRKETMEKAPKSVRIMIGERTHTIVYDEGVADAVPIIKDALKRSAALLEATADITFKVVATCDKAVGDRGNGCFGETVTPTNVTITVFNENVRAWESGIFSTVAHEYNHTVRRYSYNEEDGRPKKFNLKESLASEGVAQCFETEVNNGLTPKYARAISQKDAAKAWGSLKGRLGETNLYRAVFRGGEGEFPRWAGYTIAYLIVSKNIKDLGGDWNEITRLDAQTLIGNGLDHSG
jgi:hypothetical protein